jgi:hypothetical protein
MDDHVAVRLLAKCPKRYMAKMPLCCIVPPKCIYTLIVTSSDQKKRPLLISDEFLTLESSICLDQDVFDLQATNLDTAAIEFSKFFKKIKEWCFDEGWFDMYNELKLDVVSDSLEEVTSVQLSGPVEYP